jgi:hypothetical protein
MSSHIANDGAGEGLRIDGSISVFAEIARALFAGISPLEIARRIASSQA